MRHLLSFSRLPRLTTELPLRRYLHLTRALRMPELAEVERARELLSDASVGKTITNVKVTEDTIVFVNDPEGVNAQTDFCSSLQGRRVKEVARKGKQFYMILEGPGAQPIFHLGMSGSCGVKSGEAMYYRKKPKQKLNSDGEEWPPCYWKACLAFDDGQEWAYTDSRRLGRIKLIEAEDLTTVPPLSLLGADPYLSMPSTEYVQDKLAARSAPIKAILLDQNAIFSGIGNWLVDEILYHSRIHPAQPCNSLSPEQVAEICKQMQYVVNLAVESKADSSKFPSHWLFKHRWGKGKGKDASFTMLNGETTSIIFETVGGRTSAITSCQILDKSTIPIKSPAKKRVKKTTTVEIKEEVKFEEVEGAEVKPKRKTTKKRTVVKVEEAAGSDSELTPIEDEVDEKVPVKRARRAAKQS